MNKEQYYALVILVNAIYLTQLKIENYKYQVYANIFNISED